MSNEVPESCPNRKTLEKFVKTGLTRARGAQRRQYALTDTDGEEKRGAVVIGTNADGSEQTVTLLISDKQPIRTRTGERFFAKELSVTEKDGALIPRLRYQEVNRYGQVVPADEQGKNPVEGPFQKVIEEMFPSEEEMKETITVFSRATVSDEIEGGDGFSKNEKRERAAVVKEWKRTVQRLLTIAKKKGYGQELPALSLGKGYRSLYKIEEKSVAIEARFTSLGYVSLDVEIGGDERISYSWDKFNKDDIRINRVNNVDDEEIWELLPSTKERQKELLVLLAQLGEINVSRIPQEEIDDEEW